MIAVVIHSGSGENLHKKEHHGGLCCDKEILSVGGVSECEFYVQKKHKTRKKLIKRILYNFQKILQISCFVQLSENFQQNCKPPTST